MSVRSVLIIALGIASGTFAVFGSRMWGVVPESAVVQAPETVPVVMARERVDLGVTIRAEFLEVKEWPKELAPAMAIRGVEKVVGRVALTPIFPGELILDGKLAPEGVRRGAGGFVRPGMRAFTIMATTAASSVAGLILPGDQVDIIVSTDGGRGSGVGTTSYPLLQNVEIMAVNQRLEAPSGDPISKLQSVTLLVTPLQATVLAAAQRSGTLTLALRNPEDSKTEDVAPVSLAEIQRMLFLGGRLRADVGQISDEFGRGDGEGSADEDSLGALAARGGSSAVGVDVSSKKYSRSMIRTLRGSQSGNVSITISNN